MPFVCSLLIYLSILYTIANNLTFTTLHENELLSHLHGKYSTCQDYNHLFALLLLSPFTFKYLNILGPLDFQIV
jgi:hypothetical protein